MRYVNQGMYDTVEAARLVGVAPATLVSWTTETTQRPALIVPSLGELLSFLDLVSLRVVVAVKSHGVPITRIAAGIATLKTHWSTDQPLAHRNAIDNLATVGRSFFARLDDDPDWVDVSRGGQRAFQDLILPALRGIEYGPDDLAAIWRPAPGVWLNPRVQAGASCIDPTRIPTRMIAGLIERGEAVADVAGDYDLDIGLVAAARDFEHSLLVAA